MIDPYMEEEEIDTQNEIIDMKISKGENTSSANTEV